MQPSALSQLRTPHKHGQLVIAPTFRPGNFMSHGVDCPFPFWHEDRYYLTFVGWDGLGYRTGLAQSSNLIDWEQPELLIDRGPAGSPIEFNAALTCIIRENEYSAPGALRKFDGRFIGVYHSYPKPGYEQGPGVIGLCFSPDLRSWEIGTPVLRPDPEFAWEAGGLYKAWLLEHAGRFYLFYNAKTREAASGWIEQTGVATSSDLVTWGKSILNPLLRVGVRGQFDDTFASDPCVLKYGDMWVMFYFGYSSDGHARNSVAFSPDLLHWEKSNEVLVDVEAGGIDSVHAHKPGIICKDGRLFHFYTAVSLHQAGDSRSVLNPEMRGISFAAS